VPGLPSAEFAVSLNEVRNKALAEQAEKQKVQSANKIPWHAVEEDEGAATTDNDPLMW
jgi:hypothetical protein